MAGASGASCQHRQPELTAWQVPAQAAAALRECGHWRPYAAAAMSLLTVTPMTAGLTFPSTPSRRSSPTTSVASRSIHIAATAKPYSATRAAPAGRVELLLLLPEGQQQPLALLAAVKTAQGRLHVAQAVWR